MNENSRFLKASRSLLQMGDTVSARANIASEAHSSMRRLINTELTSHALVAINYFGNYALANIQE